jgi:hypothetical protein
MTGEALPASRPARDPRRGPGERRSRPAALTHVGREAPRLLTPLECAAGCGGIHRRQVRLDQGNSLVHQPLHRDGGRSRIEGEHVVQAVGEAVEREGQARREVVEPLELESEVVPPVHPGQDPQQVQADFRQRPGEEEGGVPRSPGLRGQPDRGGRR